jgi:hypothetical protein
MSKYLSMTGKAIGKISKFMCIYFCGHAMALSGQHMNSGSLSRMSKICRGIVATLPLNMDKVTSSIAIQFCARFVGCVIALVASMSLSLYSATAAGASEEIQVYMDDLSKAGRFGLDVHNNFVMSGSGTPEYSGAQPPNHIYRLTPEFYYGISDNFELGLYLLTTTSPGALPNYDGEKVRLKYIAPHDETQGFFWGANLEIGKTSLRVSQAPWNAQLKGIYGYRSGRWTYAGNANFDWSLSGQVSSPVAFEIDSKIAYQTHSGYHVGVESYNELGPVRHVGQFNQRGQTLYAVVDTTLGKFDLNAGIGRGLTTTSDRWLLKFIVGTHF